MNKSVRFLRLFITLLTFLMILGCSKSNTQSNTQSASVKPAETAVAEDDGIYQSTIEKVVFADDNYDFTQFGCVIGDTVYYSHVKRNEESGAYKEYIYPFDAKSGAPKGEPFTISDEGRDLTVSNLFSYGSEGFVFTTVSYEDNNPEHPVYCIYKCSLDGTVLNKKLLSEIPQIPEYSSLYGGIISDGTDIYLFTDEKLVVLDDKLRYKKTIAEGNNLKGCLGTDGFLFFLKDYSGDIYVYNPASDKVTEAVVTIASANYLYTGYDGEILVESGNSIKSYNTVTKEVTKLFNLLDVNISSSFAGHVYRDSEKNIHIHYSELKQVERDDGMGGTRLDYTSVPYSAVIRRFEPGTVSEPEIIWLACRYANPDLKSVVNEYNKAHPETKVKIKVYSDEYADVDAYEEAYDRDILNGEVYDIIKFDLATDIGKYSEKGLIENLMPYIENDPSFDINDYFENILLAEKEGDKLYSVVSSAMLDGLVGNSDVFGDKKKLSLEDIYKEREERSNIPFMKYGTDMNALFMFLNVDCRLFLGGEKDVYNFETDEFKKLCEFAATFKRSTDEFVPVYGNSAIADGTEIVGFTSYYSYSSYLYARARNSKNVRAYGGPSIEGNGYYIDPSTRYSLSALSSHKEEAWDLIKCLLNSTSDTLDGFAANRKAFNAELDDMYRFCQDGYMIRMGNESFYLSMDESDYETFSEMMEGATPKCGPNPIIRQIVAEEIPAYFSGMKSLDEVIKIIQKRVNLYLEEKK